MVVKIVPFPGPPPLTFDGTMNTAWHLWFTQMAAAFNANIAAAGSGGTNTMTSNSISPATGATYIIPTGVDLLILSPVATLGALTLVLPASALDGFQQRVITTQYIAALTITPPPGTTLTGVSPIDFDQLSLLVFQFRAATNIWYRMQTPAVVF